MKRVIYNQEEEIISIDDLNDSHIIGVEFIIGDKAQIIKVSQCMYITCLIGNENDYTCKISGASIKDLIIKMSIDIKSVHTFENKKEIINWLIAEID